MKIKLDENLTTRLVAVLEREGHEVNTVATEGLTGKPDVDVWASACREGRFFITQDLDFSDIRQFQPGTHAGLLLVRPIDLITRPPSRRTGTPRRVRS